MGAPMRAWPVTGRAFRRASISPTLTAALSFAVVLTIVGSLAYVAAVPGLAAESPLMRELFGSRVSSAGDPLALTGGAPRVVSGAVGEDGGFSAAALAAGALPLSNGDEDALAAVAPEGVTSGSAVATGAGVQPVSPGSTAGTGAASAEKSSSSAVSSPKKPSAASSGSSGSSGSDGNASPPTGGTTSGDSGNGSGNGSNASSDSSSSGGSNGGSSSNTGTNPPAGDQPGNSGAETVLPPSEGGPVPEDMELRIRDALRSEFDIMDAYAKKVYACVDDFNRLKLTSPKEPRVTAARAVDELLRECQVSNAHVSETLRIACGMSQEYGGMWGTSRYVDNNTKLQHCYGHLITMLYELGNAWSGNCYFDDPAAHEDYWGGRVTVNGKTGKMKCLEDYEKERKGARP
ncbi:hypothetical protein AALA69_02760 [Eggerthellaceae bacterium 24-137]